MNLSPGKAFRSEGLVARREFPFLRLGLNHLPQRHRLARGLSTPKVMSGIPLGGETRYPRPALDSASVVNKVNTIVTLG